MNEEEKDIKAKEAKAISMKVKSLVRDEVKAKAWAKKMSALSMIATKETNTMLLSGLIGIELNREELILATSMLIRKEANDSIKFSKMKSDVAFS